MRLFLYLSCEEISSIVKNSHEGFLVIRRTVSPSKLVHVFKTFIYFVEIKT